MNVPSTVRFFWLAVPLAFACGGGSGSPTDLEEPVPAIQSLDPNPARAGEELIIRGSNLQTPAGSLQPAQGIEVLLDGRVLTPSSATDSEIVVTLPLDITPGSHTLRVRTGAGELTNTVPFQVHIFTVTGTYRAEGPRSSDTCLIDGTPIGTVEDFEVSLTDNRPTLSMRVGAFRFNGTLGNGGDFTGQLQQMDPGTGLVSTVSLNGNMIAPQDDIAGFTAFLRLSFSGGVLTPCGVTWTLVGARFTNVATAISPASISTADRRQALQGLHR